MKNLQYHLRNSIFYIGIAITFLIPIYFADLGRLVGLDFLNIATDKTFELPKTVLFYTTSGLFILLSLIFRNITKVKSQTIENYIKYPMLLILISITISTFTSNLFPITLFGTMERLAGFWTFISVFVFAYIFVFGFLQDSKNRNIFYLSVFLSSISVSIVSILQYFGIDPISQVYNLDYLLGRSYGTLGNPNYTATYVLFVMGFGSTLWTNSKNNIQKYLIASGLFLNLVTLSVTGSRAGLLGLIIFVIFLISSRIRNITRYKNWLVLVPICLILLTPVLRRFDASNFRSVSTRLELWKGGTELISKAPWFGHGPDTLIYNYPSVITPSLLRFENLNDRPDRLHNHIFDFTYEYGLVGLVILLYILIIVISKAVRSQDIESKVLSISLISIIFCDMFGFLVITHKIYFWIVIFILISLNHLKDKHEVSSKYLVYFTRTILGIFAISNIIFGYLIYKSDHYLYSNNFIESYTMFPWNDEAKNQIIRYSPDISDKDIAGLIINKGNRQIDTYISVLLNKNITQEFKENIWNEAIKIGKYYPPLWFAYLESLKTSGQKDEFKTIFEQFIKFIPNTWQLKYKENLNPEESNRLRLLWKASPELKNLLEYYEKTLESTSTNL